MTTDTFVISSSGKATIKKDPEATLDYIFNWTDWLTAAGGDVIVSATVTPDTGLTLVTSGVVDAGRRVQAFISGGVDGVTYKVKCSIVTAASPNPRREDRVIYIKCKQDR